MSDSEEAVHPIFVKDPAEWLQYVYKKVRVLTEDGDAHEGFVYTIDPVSETIVLANFDDGPTSIDMVMGHAVTSISVLSTDVDLYRQRLDSLCLSESQMALTVEEIKSRQNRVRLWLLKNRLPITTSGTDGEYLSFTDALVIKPPYGPEDCISTNEIILGKIQGLIKNMPSDQQEW